MKSVSLLIAMVMHCQKSDVHFADAVSLDERILHKKKNAIVQKLYPNLPETLLFCFGDMQH